MKQLKYFSSLLKRTNRLQTLAESRTCQSEKLLLKGLIIFAESAAAGKKVHLCHPGSHSQAGRRRNSREGGRGWSEASAQFSTISGVPPFLVLHDTGLSLSLSLPRSSLPSHSHSWVLRCFTGCAGAHFEFFPFSSFDFVLAKGYRFCFVRFALKCLVAKHFLSHAFQFFDRINRVKKKTRFETEKNQFFVQWT